MIYKTYNDVIYEFSQHIILRRTISSSSAEISLL